MQISFNLYKLLSKSGSKFAESLQTYYYELYTPGEIHQNNKWIQDKEIQNPPNGCVGWLRNCNSQFVTVSMVSSWVVERMVFINSVFSVLIDTMTWILFLSSSVQ